MSTRKSMGEKIPPYHGYSGVKKWEIINRLVQDAVDCNYWMGRDYSYNISGTSVHDRPYDDVSIAIKASEAGMKAIVPATHFGQAFFRVPLIQKAVDDWAQETGKRGVKVIGTIHLNYANGGLNPEIVRVMLRFPASKVVYMPTSDGWHYRRGGGYLGGLKGGIELVKRGKVVPALEEIIGIMAENNMVMDITYVDAEQRFIIVDDAKKVGVKGFKTYHMLPRTSAKVTGAADATEEQWVELAKKGVKLMAGQAQLLSSRETFDVTFELMKKVGFENLIGGTDLNIWGLPYEAYPVDGLRSIISNFLLKGMSESDVEKVYKINPAKLLDL